jgi:signal transduction histidine kinase
MKDFSGAGTIDKVKIDLNAAVSHTVTMCRNEWQYVAGLTLDLDPNLPRVPCMPGDIQQVILSLVVNAAQAIEGAPRDVGKAEGSIAVSTREHADAVEIRVADNGPGIPASIRAKIFDPFFTTKEAGKGTGQGLALAYNVVAVKHHGSITVESKEGHGTTFIVRLPLECDPAQVAAA